MVRYKYAIFQQLIGAIVLLTPPPPFLEKDTGPPPR